MRKGGLFGVGGEDGFVAVGLGDVHDADHLFDGDGFLGFDGDAGFVAVFEEGDEAAFELGEGGDLLVEVEGEASVDGDDGGGGVGGLVGALGEEELEGNWG